MFTTFVNATFHRSLIPVCLTWTNKHFYGIFAFMVDRKYSQFEDLAYPILTEVFAEAELTRETRGFDDYYSIDWANAESRDQNVRIGMLRGNGRLLGLLVEPEEMQETFWIREVYGDLAKLPQMAGNDDIDLFAISVPFREKRQLKQILRSARAARQTV